jgi:hypothetical protein
MKASSVEEKIQDSSRTKAIVNLFVVNMFKHDSNKHEPGAMYPIVPGILDETMELSLTESSFAIPKSATCAVISSSNNTLLGLRSQCSTTSE